MPYIKRDIEKTIQNVNDYYPALIVTGPRQIGKTTTLRKLAGTGRTYVTLDDLEARRLARTSPETFLSLYAAPILIDEVQYAPELFSYIKMAVDQGAKPGSYWMTGSQTFQLMQLAQESLAGRAAILRMSSLSQHELYGSGEALPFRLTIEDLKKRAQLGRQTDMAGQYERIWKGSMPGYAGGAIPNREIFYSSYVQTYIQRDIRDMAERVDALQFEDFIRAAACRAGQMLNVHAISGDVGVSDETARRWLQLLEKSGVIFYVRPYSDNLLKRTVKTPKMYFFDTGLVAYLTKHLTPEILMNGAMNGAILENYVVAEIMKTHSNNGMECVAHYYRDKDNKEIDLVLQSDLGLHPIEIKKTASPSPALSRAVALLDKSKSARGMGAVLCTKQELSAASADTAIVPIWMI